MGLSCKAATGDTWQVNERIRVSTNPKPTRNACSQCSGKGNYKTPRPRRKDINGEEETFLNFLFVCFQTLMGTRQRDLISFLFSFHLTTAELSQHLSCANGVCRWSPHFGMGLHFCLLWLHLHLFNLTQYIYIGFYKKTQWVKACWRQGEWRAKLP